MTTGDIAETPMQKLAIDQWKFHSSNLWSRLQTLQVIEGAVLAAWYQVGPNTLAAGTPQSLLFQTAVLVVGSILLWMIRIVILRDADYIQACLEVANRSDVDVIFVPETGPGHGRRVARLLPGILIGVNATAMLWTVVAHGWSFTGPA